MTHPHPQNLFSGIKRRNWEQCGQDYFGTIVLSLPTLILGQRLLLDWGFMHSEQTCLSSSDILFVTSSFNEVQHKQLLLVENKI